MVSGSPSLLRAAVAVGAFALAVGLTPGMPQAATGTLTFFYVRTLSDGSQISPGGLLTVTSGGGSTQYVVGGDVVNIDVPLGPVTLTMVPTPNPAQEQSANVYVGSESTSATYNQTAQVQINANAPDLRLTRFRVEDPFVASSASSGLAGAHITLPAIPQQAGSVSWSLSDQGGTFDGLTAELSAQPAADVMTDADGYAPMYVNPSAVYGWARASTSATIGGVEWSGVGPPGISNVAPGDVMSLPIAPTGPTQAEGTSRWVAGRVGAMLGGGPGGYSVSVNGDSVTVDSRGWFRTQVATSSVQIGMEYDYLAPQLPMPVTFTASTSHDSFLDIGYPDSVAADLLPDLASQPYTDLALAPVHQCTQLRVLGADTVSDGCADLVLAPEPGHPEAVRVRYIGQTFDPSPALTLTATATGEPGSPTHPVSGTLPEGGVVLGGYTEVPMYGEASPQPPAYVAADPGDSGLALSWTAAASSAASVSGYQVKSGDTTVTLAADARQFTLASGTDPASVSVRSINEYGPSRWAATKAPDGTPPTIALRALAPVLLGSSAVVTWTARDDISGVESYDIRYRRSSARSLLGPWVSPASWVRRVSASVTLPLAVGYSYCVQVRARDHAGNLSLWSSPRCTNRPLDDRALVASSAWIRQTGSTYYLRTATTTTRRGATLAVLVGGARRLSVVASTGPSAGKIGVYLGSRLVATINLRSALVRRHVVISTAAFATYSGTVSLRSLTSGLGIQIDGLAVWKTP